MRCSRRSSFCPHGFALGLWVSLHLIIVYAAVVPTSYYELDQSNQTLSASTNDVEVHCSYERSWVDNNPFFDPKDCFGSIYFMLHEEHVEPHHEAIPLTFVSHRIAPVQGYGAIQITPRKYSPCT